MIKLKNLLLEGTSLKNESREERIEIAKKLFLDRYLEPVVDASEDVAYKINNVLMIPDFIGGDDIRAGLYPTSGDSKDIVDRLSLIIQDVFIRRYCNENKVEYQDIPKNLLLDYKRHADMVIKKVLDYDNDVYVFKTNIPLLKKYEQFIDDANFGLNQ